MRKIVLGLLMFPFLFASCSGAPDEEMTDTEEVIELSFEEGGSRTAEDYFYGILDQVTDADAKFREIQRLDQIDASTDTITMQLDSLMLLIQHGQQTLDLYSTAEWKKNRDFQEKTNSWYLGMEGLANSYYQLAEPMSRPDDTWSEEEKNLYREYETTYYDFLEVDRDWIAFQREFANANSFEFTTDQVTD